MITDQILRMVGPPVRCQYGETTVLFIYVRNKGRITTSCSGGVHGVEEHSVRPSCGARRNHTSRRSHPEHPTTHQFRSTEEEQDGAGLESSRYQPDSNSLLTSEDVQIRNECIPEVGTLPGLRQGAGGRKDSHGIAEDCLPDLSTARTSSPGLHPEQGSDVQGVPGVEEAGKAISGREVSLTETSSEDVDTKYYSKGLKRTLRQVEAALREAELLWKDITTHLSENPQTEDPKCHEHLFLNSVHQRGTGKSMSGRELRRYANLLL